jgi:hypothetical protein
MTSGDLSGNPEDPLDYDATLDRLAREPLGDISRTFAFCAEALRVGIAQYKAAGLDLDNTIPVDEVMRVGAAELMNRVQTAGGQAGEGDAAIALETLGGLSIAEKLLPPTVINKVVDDAFDHQMTQEW